MARCVASRSTSIGRACAWKRGAVRPAASSRRVSHSMQSAFSAWIIAIAPCARATASTSRICPSSSFRSS
jgi:hypothetical protein